MTVLLILLASGFWTSYVIAAADMGIITVDMLNLRRGPSLKARVITGLAKGTEVDILEEKNGWLKVRHKKRVGYVKKEPRYIHIVPSGSGRLDSGSDEAVEQLSLEAEKLRDKIDDTKEKIERFSEKEETILGRLDEIDYRLTTARNMIKNYKVQVAELERKSVEAQARSRQISKRRKQLMEYAKERLVALYKMNLVGSFSILASADSLSGFFFRKDALERIFFHDEQVRNQLIEDQKNLEILSRRMKEQKVEMGRLRYHLTREIKTMSEEREKRRKLLSKIQKQKSLELAALKAFEHAAALLDEKIESLARKPEKVELQASFSPEKPFDSYKGLLKMPVRGTIVSRFGAHRDKKLRVKHFSKGLDIRAELGEPIISVGDGVVLFADWFKGYGNMIIIDHGLHYYTVYAHAQELFKKEGDPVMTGEVIATVGDGGSMTGSKLYFEVRHYGKPVDPMEWIDAG